ncbi:YbaB/EbfC family nucleoid-associated protein [Saccharothrix deserti]|uniref:YbaB/EbfC family nucleoid-associated protein n=1 Tax=Saccharothrix deserti TaxID=2593674 RepID=UPI00192E7183|nr:YbaB/EbfC family nucleoid-associated protein [Saccharothrix deserti]
MRAKSRATAWSDDGLVEATVDAGDRLVGLRLDPRVHRNPDSAALARTVLDTVHAANREATRTAFEDAATAWSSAAATIGSLEGQLGRGVLGQAFMGRYRAGAEQVAREVGRRLAAPGELAGAGLASAAEYTQADTTGRGRFEGLS